MLMSGARKVLVPGRSVRRPAAWLLLGLVALSTGCATPSGHFCLLGYTTQPNYDPNIRTVRVPIFKNKTYRQGVEFDLTRELCHAIAQDTPFRVVNGDEPADTELCGTIVSLTSRTPCPARSTRCARPSWPCSSN